LQLVIVKQGKGLGFVKTFSVLRLTRPIHNLKQTHTTMTIAAALLIGFTAGLLARRGSKKPTVLVGNHNGQNVWLVEGLILDAPNGEIIKKVLAGDGR